VLLDCGLSIAISNVPQQFCSLNEDVENQKRIDVLFDPSRLKRSKSENVISKKLLADSSQNHSIVLNQLLLKTLFTPQSC